MEQDTAQFSKVTLDLGTWIGAGVVIMADIADPSVVGVGVVVPKRIAGETVV